MLIKLNGCEVVKENCIKVCRDFGKNEPKKNTMVEWLSCGFSYVGIVYHKTVNHIYIQVKG